MTINYEGIPDEASLIREANLGVRERMSLSQLVNWMFSVFAGKVDIGRVYVSMSDPMPLPLTSSKGSIRELAHEIQSRQKSRVMVSRYHVRAASLALKVSEGVIADALAELGCNIWPSFNEGNKFAPRGEMPNDKDLLWLATLQFCHLLSPYLAASHLTWSSWLSPTCGTRCLWRSSQGSSRR